MGFSILYNMFLSFAYGGLILSFTIMRAAIITVNVMFVVIINYFCRQWLICQFTMMMYRTVKANFYTSHVLAFLYNSVKHWRNLEFHCNHLQRIPAPRIVVSQGCFTRAMFTRPVNTDVFFHASSRAVHVAVNSARVNQPLFFAVCSSGK